MKKLLITCLLICFSTVVFAQTETQETTEQPETNDQRVNEIKLNALFLVLGGFEVSYEYLLNDEAGIDVSPFLRISKEVSDDIKYCISPYYRFYFGNKYAGGFFVEGFGMLTNIERYQEEYNNDGEYIGSDYNFVTDFAVGIGVGGKWISRRNVTFELSMGIGRNLFHSNEYDEPLIGKGGFTIGYRF